MITGEPAFKYVSVLPTAKAELEGRTYRTRGGPSVASQAFVCLKTAADTYAMLPVGTGVTSDVQTALNLKVNTSRILTTAISVDLGALAAGATSNTPTLLSGAVANDAVIVGPPTTLMADAAVIGFVSSADIVTLRVKNTGAVAFTAGTKTWRLTIVKG